LNSPTFLLKTLETCFLTWQSIYSEFYFPQKSWPEFEPADLDKAIEIYSNRKRRFGGN